MHESPLEKLERLTEKRHEDNVKRFNTIEVTMARIAGELRITVLLLVANAGLLGGLLVDLLATKGK